MGSLAIGERINGTICKIALVNSLDSVVSPTHGRVEMILFDKWC